MKQLITIALCLLCSAAIAQPDYSKTLPRPLKIYIVVDFSLVNDTTKTPCTLRLTNGDSTSFTNAQLLGDSAKVCTIKIGGNVTKFFAKKRFNFEYPNDVSPFGWPANTDFVTLADYADHSFMRNFTTLFLGRGLVDEWTPRSYMAEMYINGDYYGIVTFVEKVKRGTGRIPITKIGTSDTTGLAVTGGYFLEMKEGFRVEATDSVVTASHLGLALTFESPKSSDVKNKQLAYIRPLIDSADNSLYSEALTDTVHGYRHFFDIPSVIQWCIMQEFTGNYDRNSAFLYKERNTATTYNKIHIAPIWDFDLAYGNYIGSSVSPDGIRVFNRDWWNRMNQDTFFSNSAQREYARLRVGFLYYRKLIESQSTVLVNTGAIDRNFTKWEQLGVQEPSLIPVPVPATYDGEITRILNFIDARIKYLDTYFEYEPKITGRSISMTGKDNDFSFSNSGNPIIIDQSFESAPPIYYKPLSNRDTATVPIPSPIFGYWNFNTTTSESALLTPQIGTGSITKVAGGTSAINVTGGTGQGFDVNNYNAQNGDVSGTHLRFDNPIGGALVFNLSTTGKTSIIVKYATFRSGSGAGNQIIEYTTDGTSYTAFTTVNPPTTTPALVTLDFSAITAANNNSNFKVRITFSAGSGGTAGNNRFDNFTVQGN